MRQKARAEAAAAPAAGRQRIKAVNFRTAAYETYGLQGKPQEDLRWCNLSYDEATGQGFFLIRFAPNARSIPHEHLGYEEFVVLDGEITDSSTGATYRAGDCVSLPPGSRHFSVSATGCTTAVVVRGGFRTLDPGEPLEP